MNKSCIIRCQHDLDLIQDLPDNTLIIGIDEVGRGCLAGDICISAVASYKSILQTISQDHNHINWLSQINDSKKLSEKKRLYLKDYIEEYFYCNTFFGSVEDINIHGISKVLQLLMQQAIQNIITEYSAQNIVILIDGITKIQNIDYTQYIIKQGDSKSVHIASASILAKSIRDEYMQRLHLEYPVYQWHKNKGYGTQIHRQALQEHGACQYHRLLFLRKIL